MTPSEFQERFQTLCPHPVKLRFHECKSTYASAKKEKAHLHISLHRLFLHAPTPVLQALVRFAVSSDPEARAVIRQMANLYFTKIAPPSYNPALSNPKGVHVDLQALYDAVNHAHFQGKIEVPIAWFKAPTYRRWRHMTFGCFDRTDPSIRINQLLDHPEVPILFTEFVVFHEMLHVDCPPILDARGRMRVHSTEFQRREKGHPGYAFAKEWEKRSLAFFRSIPKLTQNLAERRD